MLRFINISCIYTVHTVSTQYVLTTQRKRERQRERDREREILVLTLPAVTRKMAEDLIPSHYFFLNVFRDSHLPQRWCSGLTTV